MSTFDALLLVLGFTLILGMFLYILCIITSPRQQYEEANEYDDYP